MTSPILLISGSNRPGANALRIAKVIEAHYVAQGVPVDLYNLMDMPAEIFSPTSYATKPPSWEPIQQRVLSAAGLHVITPEYNGSFPGVLKYFVDMLKFPESFERKPVAFVGEAAGAWGGLRAVEQLQLVFGYRNAYVFPDRVFIPGVNGKLNAEGKITDADLDKRLKTQVTAFTKFATTMSQ